MLTDVKQTKQVTRALTNGGYQDLTKQGILPDFFPVWVNEESRLNILAWRDVRKRFRITADTACANEITVHLDGGRKMKFKEVESALYLYRLNKESSNKNSKKKN